MYMKFNVHNIYIYIYKGDTAMEVEAQLYSDSSIIGK